MYDGLLGGAYRYRLELRPWIWLLSRVQDCCIFQNQSVWDIINAIFTKAGFSKTSDKRQNQAGSQVLEYCVQYSETSLDFVTRLMEKYGLYYYFTHADGEHTLVFADDPNAHTALDTAIPFAFKQTDTRPSRITSGNGRPTSSCSLGPRRSTTTTSRRRRPT